MKVYRERTQGERLGEEVYLTWVIFFFRGQLYSLGILL